MSDFQHIKVEKTEKLVFITLKREPLNVLNIEMMTEINSALESLGDGSHMKALVLMAEGKAFSAGVDVSEHTADMVDQMIGTFHRMFRLLDKLGLLEYTEGRNAPDPKLVRQFYVLVGVHLAKEHLTLVFLGQFVDERFHDPAGLASQGPEVHDADIVPDEGLVEFRSLDGLRGVRPGSWTIVSGLAKHFLKSLRPVVLIGKGRITPTGRIS